MTVVIDASVIVAAVVDDERTSPWATSLLAEERVVAPHGMPVEVASTLRRLVAGDVLSRDAGTLALADAMLMSVGFHAFAPYADRVWELRASVTPYDAWYVAIAESLDMPLATLDQRLVAAPGPRCTFLTPDWP